MPLPFGFEWSDVDNNAAAGISGFTETNGNYAARYAEIFNGARQRK